MGKKYTKFEFWGREHTKWFCNYKCSEFRLATVFKYFHWRTTESKEIYDNLPQSG